VAAYVGDWLERRDVPASDLDLVVLLLNSLDLLTDPADRLTSLTWFREVLADVGRGDIARDLRAADLRPLRDLRESLRAVFAAPAPAQAAALLNPLLLAAGAVPQLVAAGDGLRLEVAPGQRGLAALQARLPAALAQHVARHGTARLGTCAARPCECAFVDHTRGRSRRFCCATCNDRAAARQYRQRQRRA
jgi:predicted RNA-binding Zn ribbon-like protein